MVKPVAKFRAGQVSCALWENQATIDGRIVTVLKATIERRYRDAGGAWKSSNSFGRNEIPLAVYCLQRAFDHIVEKQAEEEPVSEEEVH